MRHDLVVARLEAAAGAPLPAPAAAVIPVVRGAVPGRLRSAPAPDVTPRPAAVLVLLHPDEHGEAHVVLTERATRDGHHSGEVSFPGGRAEPDDADAAATALREAAEEVGLDPAAERVRVVAELDRFWIPVSNFEVTPVVAIASARPVLVPSAAEVARIVHAPVARFLPGVPLTTIERTIGEWPLRYGAYEVDGLSVWGATARVLSQLGALLAGAERGSVAGAGCRAPSE